MRETELKLQFDQAMAAVLWARVKQLKIADGKPRARTLRSIYMDTPDHALKSAGISLRLRRNGRRWIQTVKTGRQMRDGLSQVDEVENPAPGGRVCLHAIPDKRVRDDIIQRVSSTELQPICESVFKRVATELVLANGMCAELAIDIGEIRAGFRSAQICEVEIELRQGNAAGLYDIAKTLLPDGGMRFSRLTKSDRGYLLAKERAANAADAPTVSLKESRTT